MILVPKRYAVDIIDWLDRNVAANRPYAMPDKERTAESRLNPRHLSTTAMQATWKAEDGSWEVHQSARRSLLEIRCQDPALETYIATRWS